MFHYSASSTDGKTAPEYDATSTIMNSWYGGLGVECLTFTLPSISSCSWHGRQLTEGVIFHGMNHGIILGKSLLLDVLDTTLVSITSCNLAKLTTNFNWGKSEPGSRGKQHNLPLVRTNHIFLTFFHIKNNIYHHQATKYYQTDLSYIACKSLFF